VPRASSILWRSAVPTMFDDAVLDQLEKVPAKPRKDPVLVCFYTGGVTHAVGLQTMKEVIDEAKACGITRSLVLGHSNHYGITGQGYEFWPKYISRLIQEIDNTKDYKDRPLILFGHSKGAEVAMSLASRLDDRVLKVYVVAVRPIELGKPTQWEKRSAEFKEKGEPGMMKWLSSLQPENTLLGRTANLPPAEMSTAIQESKLFREMIEIVTVQYKDATFPQMSGDSPDIRLISAPIVAVSPVHDMDNQPHIMEKWTENTTGQFQLITVDSNHVNCLSKEADVMDRLGPDMYLTATDPANCPPIPVRSDREEAALQKLRDQGISEAKHLARKVARRKAAGSKERRHHKSKSKPKQNWEIGLEQTLAIEDAPAESGSRIAPYEGEHLRLVGFFNNWSITDLSARMSQGPTGADDMVRHELTVLLADGCLSFQVLSALQLFKFRIFPKTISDDGFYRLMPSWETAPDVGGEQDGDGENFFIEEAPGTVVTIYVDIRVGTRSGHGVKVSYDIEEEASGDFAPPLAPSLSVSQAPGKQMPICNKVLASGDRLEILPNAEDGEEFAKLKKQASELSKRAFGGKKFSSRELSGGRHLTLVVSETRSKVLGYLVFKVSKSDGALYIYQLAVLEGMRNRGLGHALVAWAALRAESATCSSLSLRSQDVCADFWKACGFVSEEDTGRFVLPLKDVAARSTLSRTPLQCVWGMGTAVARKTGGDEASSVAVTTPKDVVKDTYCYQSMDPEPAKMWKAFSRWERSHSPGAARKRAAKKTEDQGPTLLSLLSERRREAPVQKADVEGFSAYLRQVGNS